MRHFVFQSMTLVFLVTGVPSFVMALNSQELSRVTISNETGYTIRYLFASASDAGVWGPDLLGARALKYGQVDSYYVHYSGSSARFDFLALDTDNDAYLIQGWRMESEHDSIIQIGQKYHIGPYRSLRITHVYLTNASNRSFTYLFFSPEDSKSWGFDILNDSTSLRPGDTFSFAVPVGPIEQKFEILALSREQATVQRQLVLQDSKSEIYIDFTLSDLH